MRRSPDQVQLVVGGAAYHDWCEADVDSDIFTPADAWHVRAKNPGMDLVSAFREGMNADIYIGEDRVMAGVIDDVSIQGSRAAEMMSLSGRDKGAWLVDSEAAAIRAAAYTLKTLAEKLLRPSFGIRAVVDDNDANRKLLLGKKDRATSAGRARRPPGLPPVSPRAIKVDPGQRIAQVLDQHTRRLGVTWWITAEGDLFLGRPTYDQEPAYRFFSFPLGDARRRQNNLLDWSVSRSLSDRYSEIVVAGQGASGRSSIFGASSATGGSFRASTVDDDLVRRGIERKLILTDGDVQTRAEAARRAELEMGRRKMLGVSIRVTVPGFRQDGRLYATDTIAEMRIPQAGIDGYYYVASRRFTVSRAAARTQLGLHPRGLWLT